MMNRNILLCAILCVIYLGCSKKTPPASGQTLLKVDGCICSVDKERKIIEIVPWSRANESWQIEARKRVSFEDRTIIESGKIKVTTAELNEGNSVDDDIKDMGGLVRRRATIHYAEEKGKQIARKIKIGIFMFRGETFPAMVGTAGAQVNIEHTKCPCPEGIQISAVGVHPQKRSGVIKDSEGVSFVVTNIRFKSDSFSYFARFSESTQQLIAVLTKTFEIVVPLSVVKSIETKGEYHEVKYQLRGEEKTVLGKLLSGDFKGKTDFGETILPSKKLNELIFTDSPAYMKEINDPLYDAIIVLKDDTRVPVAMLKRYNYTRTNHFEPYSDIRFFMGESLTTVAFANIKSIQFDLQDVMTVTLKNGKTGMGKRQMPDFEWQEGFHGIFDKGEFFIYPKNVKTIEFGVRTK